MAEISFENVHVQTDNPAPFKCTQVSGTYVDMTPIPCDALSPGRWRGDSRGQWH